MDNREIPVTGKRIRIIFEDSMKKWLFREAEKREMTVSQLVRDIISAEIKRSNI